MKLIDLTHSTTREAVREETIPVIVRSAEPVDRVPLRRLVTLATVLDLTVRRNGAEVSRADVAKFGVSDIGGCILRTGWCDRYLSGQRAEAPYFAVDAAAYLLEGGVRTVASDFPLTSAAADLLLHNDCVLVHSLSNLSELTSSIVTLVALPVKLRDTRSAPARVIAIED